MCRFVIKYYLVLDSRDCNFLFQIFRFATAKYNKEIRCKIQS